MGSAAKKIELFDPTIKQKDWPEVQKYLIVQGIWNVFYHSNFTVEWATVKNGAGALSHYIQYASIEKKKKKEKPKRRLSWDDGTCRHSEVEISASETGMFIRKLNLPYEDTF